MGNTLKPRSANFSAESMMGAAFCVAVKMMCPLLLDQSSLLKVVHIAQVCRYRDERRGMRPPVKSPVSLWCHSMQCRLTPFDAM